MSAKDTHIQMSMLGKVGSAELKTVNGTTMFTMSVAVDLATPAQEDRKGPAGWTLKDGWYTATMWFRVTTFGKNAERDAERITKGSTVYILGRPEGMVKDGKIMPRVWTGRDGEARCDFEIRPDVLKVVAAAGFQKQSRLTVGKDREPLDIIEEDECPF